MGNYKIDRSTLTTEINSETVVNTDDIVSAERDSWGNVIYTLYDGSKVEGPQKGED